MENTEFCAFLGCFVVLLFVLAVLSLSLYLKECLHMCDKFQDERVSFIKDKAESGYECYLNGNKIDINTIEILEYQVTIKEDKQIIIFTER